MKIKFTPEWYARMSRRSKTRRTPPPTPPAPPPTRLISTGDKLDTVIIKILAVLVVVFLVSYNFV